MYIRFWKEDVLVKAFLYRFGVLAPGVRSELGGIARLLSVVSNKPQMVACSGCPPDVIEVLDKCGVFTKTVQPAFRFDTVDLPTIMHKLSYSVFGRIDFFSVMCPIALRGVLQTDVMLAFSSLDK